VSALDFLHHAIVLETELCDIPAGSFLKTRIYTEEHWHAVLSLSNLHSKTEVFAVSLQEQIERKSPQGPLKGSNYCQESAKFLAEPVTI
jgi:hypothetical protein